MSFARFRKPLFILPAAGMGTLIYHHRQQIGRMQSQGERKLNDKEYSKDHIYWLNSRLALRTMVNSIHLLWLAGCVTMGVVLGRYSQNFWYLASGVYGYIQIGDILSTDKIVTDLIMSPSNRDELILRQGMIWNRASTIKISRTRLLTPRNKLPDETYMDLEVETKEGKKKRLLLLNYLSKEYQEGNLASDFNSKALLEDIVNGNAEAVKAYKKVDRF